MTSDADRRRLLQIARETIVAHVSGAPPPVVPAAGALLRPAGVFVTLHAQGSLRGCIGHLQPDRAIADAVARCAVSACSADPRFPAVTASEVADIDIELSILGPLEAIASPDEIEIGRHGLVVERGWRRGLLLPQVAAERHWDRSQFVEQTCHKAGLPLDAWRHGADLWKFEAEVFSEGRWVG